MKLGVLLSGGKDSLLALYRASKFHKISCLININSLNQDSFVFHTPASDITVLQSEALGIPLIRKTTKGVKGKELLTLRKALSEAIRKYDIQGVVSGAVMSSYQNIRFQKICNDLKLTSFNPLWLSRPFDVLNDLIKNNFEVIVSSVAAYPLDKNFIGRRITDNFVKDMRKLNSKFSISPTGEGGEFETLVLDMPLFKKRIKIKDYEVLYKSYSGRIIIRKAELVDKNER